MRPWAAALGMALLAAAALRADPPHHLVVSEDPCRFGPCPAVVLPPIPVQARQIRTYYVAAFDAQNQLDYAFHGTVAFSSSDPIATLPGPATISPQTPVASVTVIFQASGPVTLRAAEVAGLALPGEVTVDVVPVPPVPMLTRTAFPIADAGFVQGLAAGPDGNLWYTTSYGIGITGFSFFTSKVGRVTPSGQVRVFPLQHPSLGANVSVGSLAAGTDALWAGASVPPVSSGFAQTPHEILRIFPGTEPSFAWIDSSRTPIGLALGSDGAMWFTDGSNEIGRVSASGSITTYAAPHVVDGRITSGAADDLWFTETSANAIGRITTAGSVTEYPLFRPNSRPDRIARDANGGIWFTEPLEHRICTYNVSFPGSIREWEFPGRTMAAGPDGAIWFSDGPGLFRAVPAPVYVEPAFQRFSTAGLTGEIAAGPDGTLWYAESTLLVTEPRSALVRVQVSPCPEATLCLDGRFQATVSWKIGPGLGPTFQAAAVQRSENDGYFWFFTPGNVELAVKVVDGRAFNGRYWVFAGSLTTVPFTLTVTDTATGETKTYVNPDGTLASIADTAAF